MHFVHNFFGISIDTELEELKNNFQKLENLYKKIPNTICLFCPKKTTVEADCCKHFSPPMYLIEFINSLKEIQLLSKEDENKLLFSCYKSFLNPNIIRPCVLLKDTLCSIYSTRPFSCRVYPSYPKKEWENRLNTVAKEWNIPISEIPMKDQCPNVKVKGMPNKLTAKDENEIFKNICDIDITLFDSPEFGQELAYSAATYLPFDAHYLLMKIGADKLEELSDIRSLLIKEKEDMLLKNTDSIRLKRLENEVEDLLKDVWNNIAQNNIGAESEKN